MSTLGHRGERCAVMADVGDFVRNDQVVPGIDRSLHVVADHAGAFAAGGHGACIWIGERLAHPALHVAAAPSP